MRALTARLLAAQEYGTSLADHRALYGDLRPPAPSVLLDEVEQSGLRGRGGAGFPTGRKMRAVAAGQRPVVLGNACEGEPGSLKDAHLLLHAPHLVLDGLHMAAHAVGATQIHLAVHAGSPSSRSLRAALTERRERRRISLVEVPHRYVASEESALVSLINGGPAQPMFTPPRPFESGIDKRPTLINNAETLAQVALIARYGPSWFRAVGDPEEPGTQLLTVTGPALGTRVWSQVVVEVPTGLTVQEAYAVAGLDLVGCQAVLVGGYFGAWQPLPFAGSLRLTHRDMTASGGSLGAGILIALPQRACGLAETAAVAAYLAGESAGQCGPCFNGLPAIASAIRSLARGPWDERTVHDLDRWLTVIPGRGACRHPDGAVRFVQSALRTFAQDVQSHRRGRPCGWHESPSLLPLPTPPQRRQEVLR